MPEIGFLHTYSVSPFIDLAAKGLVRRALSKGEPSHSNSSGRRGSSIDHLPLPPISSDAMLR
jgi:hypothetical protein